MHKSATFAAALAALSIHAFALAAGSGVLVTTKSPVAVTTSPGAHSAQMTRPGGDGNTGTTCKVASTGTWACTIDGKDYYCVTPNNPDPQKDCFPAKTVVKPSPIHPAPPVVGVMARH